MVCRDKKILFLILFGLPQKEGQAIKNLIEENFPKKEDNTIRNYIRQISAAQFSSKFLRVTKVLKLN